MKLNDISKPITAKSLNETLAKRFGKRIDFESFTLEQLENARNKVRTKLSQIETNESFDKVTKEDYQKEKLFLDVLNAAIKERANNITESINPRELGKKAIAVVREYIERGYDRKKAIAETIKQLRALPVDQVILQKVIADLSALAEKADPKKVAKKENARGTAKTMKPPAKKIKEAPNFSPADIKGIERSRDVEQARSMAMQAITKSTIKPDKQKYFARQIQSANTTMDIVKLFYSMLLSGEGMGTIGTSKGMAKSAYRKNYEGKSNLEKALLEGEEDKAELVMAAKDMVDRLTGWMEDTAEMQTETMLDLSDAIRDEMGSEVSEQFAGLVKPALDQLYQTMETVRTTLTTGVGQLTGEQQPMTPMGADDDAFGMDDMEMDPSADDGMGDELDPEADGEELPTGDEFDAAAAASGGPQEAGRAKRESIERSRRLYSILAGGSKKK